MAKEKGNCMLEGIKAVIFDLDGTLVDSMWIWKSIDIDFLSSRNLAFPEDLQREVEGKSFSETAVYFKERFSLTESIDEIKAIWNEMAYDKYKYEIELKPGAKEFLSWLKRHHIVMGIATSNSRELVDVIMERHHLEKYIKEVHTSCEVSKGKPAPDIYLKVAGHLNVEPKECLVFEDIVNGIMAGKNAGMKVCCVEDKYGHDELSVKKELADYYIEDFTQIKLSMEENVKDFSDDKIFRIVSL